MKADRSALKTRVKHVRYGSTQIRAVLAHKSTSPTVVSRDTSVALATVVKWLGGDLPVWFVAEEAERAKAGRRVSARFYNSADARFGR